MTGITEEELKSFVHPSSMRTYQRTSASEQARILKWVPRLQQMSDSDFVIECASRVIDSAIMNRFRGNAWGIHARADICDDEAKRRHQLAGHDTDCRGSNLYTRGHNEALRSQRHAVRPLISCTCGHGPKVQ